MQLTWEMIKVEQSQCKIHTHIHIFHNKNLHTLPQIQSKMILLEQTTTALRIQTISMMFPLMRVVTGSLD